MHEMSIIEALLEQIRLHCPTAMQVRAVRLRVGALRQVLPEALTFCYEAAVRGTFLEGSRLQIEQLPAEARCRHCSLTFAVEDYWFECPRCNFAGAELLRGDELQLLSLELSKPARS
jgi:hydrogenase nickel incorporation protein HypA/HybF